MHSDRLLALLLLLQTQPRTSAAKLAQQLEVSKRTIYRDIDALSAAGVPVYAERGRNGGAALLPGYRADVTGLTAEEARALFVFGGRGALPLGLDASLRSALRKLLAALPEHQRPDAVRAQERVIVEHHGWGQQADQGVGSAKAVREAIWLDRRVRIRYRAADAAEPREHVLDPYGIVVKAGIGYLIAASRGEPRMYRMGRIERAETLDEPSERPANLDLEALWEELKARFESRGDACDVVFRVRESVLPLLRRMTARSARDVQVRETSDGWVTVSAVYPAEGAAVASLLMFGPDVEALEPPTLRRAIGAAAAATAALYANAG